LDGQIWALKADSLTSPVIVTVTVTVTDRVVRKIEIHAIHQNVTKSSVY